MRRGVPWSARRRGDEGTALVEFTWLAILLLVPLVWIVLSVFEVQRGAFAVTAAARAAGRAYALADDDASGRARADAAAAQVMADHAPGQEIEIDVSCEPVPTDCHAGTSVITVRVHSRVVLPMSPEVLGHEAATFELHASHTVPIGQYVEGAAPEGGEERAR